MKKTILGTVAAALVAGAASAGSIMINNDGGALVHTWAGIKHGHVNEVTLDTNWEKNKADRAYTLANGDTGFYHSDKEFYVYTRPLLSGYEPQRVVVGVDDDIQLDFHGSVFGVWSNRTDY